MSFITVHGNLNPDEDMLVAVDSIVSVMENPVGTGSLIVLQQGSLTVVDSVEDIADQLTKIKQDKIEQEKSDE